VEYWTFWVFLPLLGRKNSPFNTTATMGIFSFLKRQPQVSQQSLSNASWSRSSFPYLGMYTLNDPQIQSQVAFFIVFMAMLFSLRLFSTKGTKTLSGQHILNIHNLNDVILFKEVFLTYLNAAILEPILSIGSLESGETAFVIKVMTNLFELLSLCWWVWLLTDAFDFNDVMFQYKYVG
jgi:hypothetical protein